MPPIAREFIDPDADKVVRRLRRYGHSAFLVGGCVRDLLVGKAPKDFDVATSATPQEIKNVFRNCRVIGRRFRLAHIFFGQKIIETSTFRANPREGASDDDDTELLIRRDNVFGTAEEDARRRDFTINGLFYDVEKEEVIDHVGGLADLEARLVRTIGDPDLRFPEDPVRILRAIKFAARLNFEIEPSTYEALLNHQAEIPLCAPPRVLEEIYRLLKGGAARRSMELLLETGVMHTLAPELVAMFQGPPWLEGSADPQEHDFEDPYAKDRERSWRVLDELDNLVGRAPPPLYRRRGRVYVEPPATPLPSLAARPLDEVERLALLAVERPFPMAPGEEVEPSLSVERAAPPPASGSEDEPGDAVGDDSDIVLTNSLLLGAMVVAFVREAHVDRPADLYAAVEDALAPVATRLHVSRRDFERTRQILLLERRLAPSRRRRGRPTQLARREYFAEALALYELDARASGEPGDELARWKHIHRRTQATVPPGGDLGEGDEPRAGLLPEPGAPGLPGDLAEGGLGKKRRRRRRGGRNRHKSTGPMAGEIDGLVAVSASDLPPGPSSDEG